MYLSRCLRSHPLLDFPGGISLRSAPTEGDPPLGKASTPASLLPFSCCCCCCCCCYCCLPPPPPLPLLLSLRLRTRIQSLPPCVRSPGSPLMDDGMFLKPEASRRRIRSLLRPRSFCSLLPTLEQQQPPRQRSQPITCSRQLISLSAMAFSSSSSSSASPFSNAGTVLAVYIDQTAIFSEDGLHTPK